MFFPIFLFFFFFFLRLSFLFDERVVRRTQCTVIRRRRSLDAVFSFTPFLRNITCARAHLFKLLRSRGTVDILYEYAESEDTTLKIGRGRIGTTKNTVGRPRFFSFIYLFIWTKMSLVISHAITSQFKNHKLRDSISSYN